MKRSTGERLSCESRAERRRGDIEAAHDPRSCADGRERTLLAADQEFQLVMAASQTPGITDVARCVSGGILGPLLVW